MDPDAVGDGMDTWHWWVGSITPSSGGIGRSQWREGTIARSMRAWISSACCYEPRADRWAKMGLINDPDTVPADKPDQYGLMIDRMKDGALTWDPEVFGLFQWRHWLQLFPTRNSTRRNGR